MRILIAKNNPIYAGLLAAYLKEKNYNNQIISNIQDCSNETMSAIRPDIIIIGQSSHPDGAFASYLNLTSRFIFQTSVKFILIFKDEDTIKIKRAIKLGVSGIIHEQDEVKCFVECLKNLSLSSLYLSPNLLKICLKNDSEAAQKLTSTELQIAHMILSGNNTHQIAVKLFRSEETIKSHRKSIKSKLGIRGGKNKFVYILSNLII